MKHTITIAVIMLAMVAWGRTNMFAVVAANAISTLMSKWIASPDYPRYDTDSGIGQGIGVQYCGTQSNAPSRILGIVVSRIITDKTKTIGGGEKWCLVEFGEGPPWKGYPLTNLTPIAISKALKDFPPAGMKTVMAMLGKPESKSEGVWK